MPRTPDPEVGGGSSPTRVKPCCVLEQCTFTPQKVLVIPRKRWLRPNMTEKLFTGTLRINQPTNLLVLNPKCHASTKPSSVVEQAVLCRTGWSPQGFPSFLSFFLSFFPSFFFSYLEAYLYLNCTIFL